MKHQLLAVIGILSMLLGLLPGSVFTATPASAQVAVPVPGAELTVNAAAEDNGLAVEPGPKIYLPIVVTAGQHGPQPASPYAAALSQALADCSGTTLNQVCYASGSVTLAGGGPLTTPGQTAALDGVTGLTLVSPDAGRWSVALLRLAADSTTPGLGLTLLAFGNVEIRGLTLFDAAAGNGDLAPALSFRSSPVPGQDPETGGLIVYNPNHEEPLFINLNGADLTLASSAVVQAQPGAKMTVTMATGGALVSTAAGDSAVIQGQQLGVPLDENGAAAGESTDPTEIDDDLLVPLVTDDWDNLLTPLVPTKPPLDSVLASLLDDFDSAYHRCMQGNSRQVYRVMYFARLIKLSNEASDDLLGMLNEMVKDCATFEMEFNSDISATSNMTWGSTYVQGQGMIVSFDMYGNLVKPAEMPLTHLRYDFDWVRMPMCSYQLVLTDGVLNLFDGYMRINHNRLDISTKVYRAVIDESLILTCEGGSITLPAYAIWRTMFMNLHQSEAVDNGMVYLFTPEHWKYTGNQILAEAIFTRQAAFQDGSETGDTGLVMVHKPGG